ncbi:unnamed protein product, partial [Gulo gulo]
RALSRVPAAQARAALGPGARWLWRPHHGVGPRGVRTQRRPAPRLAWLPGRLAIPLGPEPAHQREPLRQQEECRGEHAGHRAADGQRFPAEGCHRAGSQLRLLRPPGGPHLHLPRAADWRGRAAHLPWFRYDLNNPAKHAKLDFLNNLATGLVFIIVVVNIFITAFGVQKPVMDVAPRQ